jgi:PEGA domain
MLAHATQVTAAAANQERILIPGKANTADDRIVRRGVRITPVRVGTAWPLIAALAGAWTTAATVHAQPPAGARRAAGATPAPAPAPGPRPPVPGDVAGEEGPGPEEALTQRIAVWRIDALGMQSELVARLETLFRMELDRLATRPLPTRMQIDKAIGAGALAACSGDDKCVADIGKKVGVDVMVAGSVAALGDSYILNIKAVDVATAKQIRRIATDPLRGSPDELIEAIRVAAYRLLAPDQLHGSVVILTDSIGAQVTLDGKPAGKTPLPGPLAKLPLGTHALRVDAPGYVPFEDKVEVRFQKSTRVVVRLVTQDAPITGGVVPTRTVVRGGDTHWYTSPWMYVAVGAAAIVVGGIVGHELGKQPVIDCTGPNPPGVCK